ncbi:ribonuclease P protein component 4 [Nanoarchaeota archaeon]
MIRKIKSNMKKKGDQQKIALERIIELFKQAKLMYKEDPKLSDRYVKLAWKIKLRYKIKMPANLKKQICKHCKAFLLPGKSARVRLTNKKVVYYCSNCKKYMRHPYVKEIKEKRKN